MFQPYLLSQKNSQGKQGVSAHTEKMLENGKPRIRCHQFGTNKEKYVKICGHFSKVIFRMPYFIIKANQFQEHQKFLLKWKAYIQKSTLGWGDGSNCSCRGPRSDSQLPCDSSQPSVTLAPGHGKSLWWPLREPGTHEMHRHTCQENTWHINS